MDEEARVPGARGTSRLVEDSARAGMGVLEEWRGASFEVEGLLPPEQDPLLRLDPRDVVPDCAHPDELRDLPLPRFGEVLPPLGDLRVRPVDGLVEEVVEVHDEALPRGQATLRQAHERVEEGLWGPVDPEEPERGLEPLERELLVLPEDVDRDVASFHLVEVVRDVPSRVERRPMAGHEEVLRRVPFEAVSAQVEVARTVLLAAPRREALDDVLDPSIEDEVALPEEGVVRHVDAGEGLENPAEDPLGDLTDLAGEGGVPPLEPLDELHDLRIELGPLLEERGSLLVVLHEAVVVLLSVRGSHVLRGQVFRRPVLEDHLLPDVVHEVLPRDPAPREAEDPRKGVPVDRVPRAADVNRPRRVDARVLKEDPFGTLGRYPVGLPHRPHGGEDERREGPGVLSEVHVGTLSDEGRERGRGGPARDVRGDLVRRPPERLREREGGERE